MIFHRGFTLIEIIVVIVIIGILSAVGANAYYGMSEKANYSQLIADARQIASAVNVFQGEYGYYPKDGNKGAPGVGLYAGQDPNNDKDKFNAIMSFWPSPVCKDWFFDWENWNDPTIDHIKQTYRISIRRNSDPNNAIFFYCLSSNDPKCVGTGGVTVDDNGLPFSFGGGVEIRDLPSRAVTCKE